MIRLDPRDPTFASRLNDHLQELEDKIEELSRRPANIVSTSIKGEHFQPRSINLSEEAVVDRSLPAIKIADRAIISEKIADGAVVPDKIASFPGCVLDAAPNEDFFKNTPIGKMILARGVLYIRGLTSFDEMFKKLKPFGVWKLDELTGTVADDLSDNHYDLTYVGGPTLGLDPVLPESDGYAVGFGNGQYAERLGNALPARDKFSFECWFFTARRTEGTVQCLFYAADSGGGEEISLQFLNDGTTAPATAPNGVIRLVINGLVADFECVNVESILGARKNHLALTWESDVGDAKLYINGSLIGAVNLNKSATVDIDDIYIGNNPTDTTRYWGGRLANFVFYDNHELTQDEVLEHFSRGRGEITVDASIFSNDGVPLIQPALDAHRHTFVHAYVDVDTAVTGDLTCPFNAEYHDYGNNFDTTTFIYTCPEDGMYDAQATLQYTGNIAGTDAAIRFETSEDGGTIWTPRAHNIGEVVKTNDEDFATVVVWHWPANAGHLFRWRVTGDGAWTVMGIANGSFTRCFIRKVANI